MAKAVAPQFSSSDYQNFVRAVFPYESHRTDTGGGETTQCGHFSVKQIWTKADFGLCDVTPHGESLELPLSRQDRIMLRVLRGIDYTLAGLFLGGVGGFVWGVIGH